MTGKLEELWAIIANERTAANEEASHGSVFAVFVVFVYWKARYLFSRPHQTHDHNLISN
jgi:hypothetical protein